MNREFADASGVAEKKAKRRTPKFARRGWGGDITFYLPVFTITVCKRRHVTRDWMAEFQKKERIRKALFNAEMKRARG
jgi:hypothetical protein